jgi:hypothetical protein
MPRRADGALLLGDRDFEQFLALTHKAQALRLHLRRDGGIEGAFLIQQAGETLYQHDRLDAIAEWLG